MLSLLPHWRKIILIWLAYTSLAYTEEEKPVSPFPFQAYKSNYAIFDPEDTEIKFQFSIKFQLATIAAIENPWKYVENFYFGYSQKSFWDVGKPSAPFSDHNFNPEFFYGVDRRDGILRGYRIGLLEHESNGEDGEKSRSWDRIYVRPVFRITDHITLAPKAWVIINEDENNSDIEEFSGYFELSARYLSERNLKVEITGRKGKDSGKGSIRGDISFPWQLLKDQTSKFLSIPPFTSSLRFNPHWLIQGWYGYGENLLNYNKKESIVRFGILFSI